MRPSLRHQGDGADASRSHRLPAPMLLLAVPERRAVGTAKRVEAAALVAACGPLSRFHLSKDGRGGKARRWPGGVRGAGATHTYLGARGCAAQVVESGKRETAHPRMELAVAGLRWKVERVKGDPARSGCECDGVQDPSVGGTRHVASRVLG